MISKGTMLLNPSVAMKTLLIHAVLSFVGATSPELFYNATQSSQLAHFVAKLATQSFPPDKILLVSSTEYDDTVDMMLKRVHQYTLWHLHVSRPDNLVFRRMKEQEDKVGSYVMFTTGHEDAVSQAEGLIASTSWNNRALFLVVVRNPTANPERLALSVVENLWENVRVFNIVILVATDTTFHLYTWFPYGQHKQCGEVRQLVPINVLNGAGNRNITTDIKLFSYQAPTNFWGCPVTVSSIYRTGTSQKLISDFLLRLNFSVTYIHSPTESSDYVTRATGAVARFISGYSDIVTAIVPQYDLIKLGEPSQDVEWYKHIWYVPCAKPIDRIEKIATIFSVTLWIAMIVVFMATVITIWQLARLSRQDDTYKDISTILYNGWAVVVGVGVTKMPQSNHLRIVIFAWICYCFSISTVFQTFFTSFLVDPGLHKQIANLHELSQSKMEYGVPPGIGNMYDIEDELINITNKGHPCHDSNKCVERIIDTGNFALFGESRSINEYLASAKKKDKVCVMNYYDVDPQKMVNLFSRGTQILEQFNKFVTRMQESGEITKHEKDVWTNSSHVDDEEDISQTIFVFSISHLLVAFYVLSIGHSLGFVMFLLEMLPHSYSTHRQRTLRRKITEHLS
jgi:hypothetical protein